VLSYIIELGVKVYSLPESFSSVKPDFVKLKIEIGLTAVLVPEGCYVPSVTIGLCSTTSSISSLGDLACCSSKWTYLMRAYSSASFFHCDCYIYTKNTF
jgi:hypothetical protein